MSEEFESSNLTSILRRMRFAMATAVVDRINGNRGAGNGHSLETSGAVVGIPDLVLRYVASQRSEEAYWTLKRLSRDTPRGAGIPAVFSRLGNDSWTIMAELDGFTDMAISWLEAAGYFIQWDEAYAGTRRTRSETTSIEAEE